MLDEYIQSYMHVHLSVSCHVTDEAQKLLVLLMCMNQGEYINMHAAWWCVVLRVMCVYVLRM